MLDEKYGSKAIPNKPLSPALLAFNDRKGVHNKIPFLRIFILPAFSQIKIRPSGAKAKFVGLERPDATATCVTPEG